MFNILKEEAKQYLHPNKDIQEQKIPQKISFSKNIIYRAIHHNKDQFQQYYKQANLTFQEKQIVFTSICTLYNQKEFKNKGRSLITKLLQIQHQNLQLMKLISMDIYKDITFSNSRGLEKKYNRIYTKTFYENQRIKLFNQSSKAYSQLMLILSIFFQNGKINYSTTQILQKIMSIVGMYSLDMDRVIDAILQNAIITIDNDKINQLFDLLNIINSPNTILLIMLKLNNYQELKKSKQPLFYGQLQQIINLSTQQLYKNSMYHYNPLYIKLLCRFIIIKPENMQQVLQYANHFTPAQLHQLQFQRLIMSQKKMQDIFMCSMQNVSQKQQRQLQNKQQLIFKGQLFHCIKFCMMVQYIKDNNFIQFKKLYDNFSQCKLDIILFLPLIRQICLLIQWIIDPVYTKISYRKYFKGYSTIQLQNNQKQDGYFKRSYQINMKLFKDLFQLLKIIKIYIGFKITTYIKLCRFLEKIMRHYKEDIFKECIKNIVMNYLIGGVCLQKEHPAMAVQLYHLLQRFEQQQRFYMYSYYYSDIISNYPYLNYLFQKISAQQTSLYNKFVTINPRKEIMNILTKHQYNNFFQSCYILSKKIIFYNNDQNSTIFAKILDKSPKISKDVLLFLMFGQIMNNKQQFTNKLLSKNEKQFNTINYFMYEILQQGKTQEKSSFLKFLFLFFINSLNKQNVGQQIIIPIKMMAYLLEKIFPCLTQYHFTKQNYDFLISGFYMKLDYKNFIQPFIENKYVRAEIMSLLCQKVKFIENQQNQNDKQNDKQNEQQNIKLKKHYHSRLYIMISLINSNIKKIQQNKCPSLDTMGHFVDQCNNLMYKITKFYYYQLYTRIQEISQKGNEPAHISQIQFQNMIIKQKTPLLICFILYKALKKFNPIATTLKNSVKFDMSIKNTWEKINQIIIKEIDQRHDRKLASILKKLPLLPQIKVANFLKSQLFFHFWMGQIENISDLQLKYAAKNNEYRQILLKKQVKVHHNKQAQTLKQKNKAKYLRSYNLIAQQQTFCHQQYKNYHTNYKSFNKSFEIVNKFTITSNLLQKNKDYQDLEFNNFINLLTIHCILPRLLMDSTQAIYCSRYAIKIIKQNRLVLKRSISMICNMVEAVIHYLPFSTERQAIKSIPIFANDLLGIIRQWENPQKFKASLENYLSIEKYNEKRYEKLKEYLSIFIGNLTCAIVSIKHDIYLIKNCMYFLQKCDSIPLCREQGEEILKYLSLLSNIYDADLKQTLTRMTSVISHRIKNTSYIRPKISQQQLRQLNMNRVAREDRKSPFAPKIYLNQDKEDKKNKFYDSNY